MKNALGSRQRACLLSATACVGLLISCGAPEVEPVPVNKTLSVQAGQNVNQYNNASNPTVVRIYQLSSRSEFEAATFWDIFHKTSPDLAGAVLDERSLSPLYPNETRLVAFDLVPDVFYLGAFAEFADYETQQFRSVVPIDVETLDEGVTISVTTSGVSIQYRNATEDEVAATQPVKKKGFFGRMLSGAGKLFGGGE
ncbi:type VI secretion system lipoprotein TssJ [Epibacterium ulvae]|uniref:Type VI secretion lipoprotein, VasD, EvfM, TssJ, VC_A0113 n=1 Tax=Epibacterium ulvae TaxID=1156985 RepID=A0A1G5QJG1_9RHOB|nr:type VI secretion system lipoprotein TssJ [Epibacterium ulvae]SCZ61491.1 Type VI secretion lipoprotein, VasD, EvfM, TssJ, VC_A0113 [Epibacterium ulvae]